MNHFPPFQKIEVLKDDDLKISSFQPIDTVDEISSIIHSVYFQSPISKLVTVSDGVRIYSLNPLTRMSHIHQDQRFMHVIKWSKETFIVCSLNKIYAVSIIPPFNIVKEIIKETKGSAYRIGKLNDDKFIYKSSNNIFAIYQYSTGKVLKEYKLGYQYSAQNHMVLSKNYENCIYIPVQDEKDSIFLVDFESHRIVKHFKEHVSGKYIKAISTIHDTFNEELLICCDTTDVYYCYKTSDEKFNVSIDTEEYKKRRHASGHYGIPNTKVYCCVQLNNQFLFAGEKKGNAFLYEFLFDDEKLKLRKLSKFIDQSQYGAWVNHITIFEENITQSDGKQDIEVALIKDEKTLRIMKIQGVNFKFKSGMDMVDLKERVEFLSCDFEMFVFDNKDLQKQIFVNLRIGNTEFENCCLRILFMMQ